MRALLLLLTSLALASCASPKNGSSASATASSGGTKAAVSKSVLLSWTASTGNPTGYQVFQSNDGVTYALAATVTTNSATVGSLTSGTTYYFYVRSYNAGGYSPSTTAISVHP